MSWKMTICKGVYSGIITSEHPNGQTVRYAYDCLKRVTGVQTITDGKIYKNAYVNGDNSSA